MSTKHRAMVQTGEAVTFLVALAGAHHEATRDGKLSLADGVRLLGLLPSAIAAIGGMNEIPAELADADGAEIDGLLTIIAAGLNERLDNARHRRIAERALVATHALADLAAEIVGNNPPKPEIVP